MTGRRDGRHEGRLTYGLREGILVSVLDVPRGKACACVCPACGDALVAKRGTVVQPHFAHASGSECSAALETALHLGAKQILAERRQIVLPAVKVSFYSTEREPITLAEERLYELEGVVLERRAGNVIPDVLAMIRGRPVAIEILVTHAVDVPKLQQLRRQGLSTVEIDLSAAARTVEMNELAALVVDGGPHKRWVFNDAAERRHAQVLAEATRRPIVQRGFSSHVDDCPRRVRVWRGRGYANITDNCLRCRHALHVDEEMRWLVCDGVEDRSQGPLFD